MHWNAPDLERRLANALQVAGRAVAFLGDGGWQAERADGVRPEKVLSETALFLLASRDACERTPALSGAHRRVAQALLPHARNERIAALIALEPVVALDHALMHLCLSRLGFGDARFDRLLAASLRGHGAAGRERVPHRAMEQQWLARLAEPPSAAAPARTRRCLLDHPLDALAPVPDDLYAFTHCLLFSTDLGARPMRFLRPGGAIAADAQAALARCLDLQDFDLAGELLMTWPLLRRRWSTAASFGFLCLVQAEEEAGFVPAPGMSLRGAAALSGDERTRHLLAASYHTIYVMGMLCALALQTGQLPQAAIAPASRHAPAIAPLRDACSEALPGAQVWSRVFERQPAHAQGALAPFLLTLLLQRATARRDLGTLQRLLGVAARFGLLGTPATRQALELLQRAALLGGMDFGREPGAVTGSARRASQFVAGTAVGARAG